MRRTTKPTKYKCLKSNGRWWVRPPVHDMAFVSHNYWREFPSFHEALLFIRAHVRMDVLGVPRDFSVGPEAVR